MGIGNHESSFGHKNPEVKEGAKPPSICGFLLTGASLLWLEKEDISYVAVLDIVSMDSACGKN